MKIQENKPQYGTGINNGGEKFDAFTKKIAKDEQNLISDILNGTIKTEEQRANRHLEISNQTFEVLPDEYRQLALKQGKTSAEIERMKTIYKNGFLDFGESYLKYLDKKFGNGDGKLTRDEFIKSQLDESLEDHISIDEQKIMANNVFDHVNIIKDDNIDKKEMAAMMSMFDMSIGLNGDKGGGLDGKIKAVDYNGNIANLVKPLSDQNGKAIDDKIKMMFNFLFGNN